MKKTAKAAPKQKAKRDAEPDVNQLAHHLVRMSTQEKEPPTAAATERERKPSKSEISRVMAELGRRGGKLGGKARANALTEEQRITIAANAARKRWSRQKNAGTI